APVLLSTARWTGSSTPSGSGRVPDPLGRDAAPHSARGSPSAGREKQPIMRRQGDTRGRTETSRPRRSPVTVSHSGRNLSQIVSFMPTATRRGETDEDDDGR